MIIRDIKALQSLELKAENYDKIKGLLGDIVRVVGMQYFLPKWEKIERGRLVGENETLMHMDELLHRPQEKNKTYQRASTPHKTMFYGSIFPHEEANKNIESVPRITVMHELCSFLRTKTMGRHKQRINIGVFRNVIELNLFCICQYKFPVENTLMSKTNAVYKENISKYPENERMEILAMADFISSHFANPDIGPDTDYMISAIFTEVVTEMGFDGVIFPSVRMGGAGSNICVTPDVVKNKIAFEGNGECDVYKYDNGVWVNNLSIALPDDIGNLQYENIREYSDETSWKFALDTSNGVFDPNATA